LAIEREISEHWQNVASQHITAINAKDARIEAFAISQLEIQEERDKYHAEFLAERSARKALELERDVLKEQLTAEVKNREALEQLASAVQVNSQELCDKFESQAIELDSICNSLLANVRAKRPAPWKSFIPGIVEEIRKLVDHQPQTSRGA
jgi:chromosome segregation ATPase